MYVNYSDYAQMLKRHKNVNFIPFENAYYLKYSTNGGAIYAKCVSHQHCTVTIVKVKEDNHIQYADKSSRTHTEMPSNL
jgi:hypothetical protein